MKAFTSIDGLVCPLDRANVDTDAIIPKQFLKSIKRSGFGPYLFDEWRYTNYGEPGMDCSTRPLNIVAPADIVDQLFRECEAQEGYCLKVDLESQTVTLPSGQSFGFDITPHRKHCLLNGLDEIGLTLQHADEIRAFEAKHKASRPWLFA